MSLVVDLAPFDLSLREPFLSGSARITNRRGIAIRVGDGVDEGIGEAAPLPGWTESYDACRDALEGIPGEDVTRPSQISLPNDRPAARHAIQLAVLDFGARRAGLSLARYLVGKKATGDIPVNAVVGNVPVDEAVDRAREAVADGYGTVKCKAGGRHPATERERIDAVRRVIGPEVSLRVDANGAWTREEAGTLWPALVENDVETVEEPFGEPDPEAIEEFSGGPVEVALDETIVRRDRPLARWLEVVDALVVKPMAMGGVDRAFATAMRALECGVTPIISCTVDGVVARTAAIHLAAAIPDLSPAGLATADLLEGDLAPDPAPMRGGRIPVPTDPGLGTRGPWEVENG